MTAFLKPTSRAPALYSVPICETICTWCSGSGQVEATDNAGEDFLIDCEDCQARGTVEVPDNLVSVCEICGRTDETTDGVCRTCYMCGLVDYAAEMPDDLLQNEMDFAKSVGWLM